MRKKHGRFSLGAISLRRRSNFRKRKEERKEGRKRRKERKEDKEKIKKEKKIHTD